MILALAIDCSYITGCYCVTHCTDWKTCEIETSCRLIGCSLLVVVMVVVVSVFKGAIYTIAPDKRIIQ